MSYREPIVVVLGHVDHGKCVGPQTEVYTEEMGWLRASEVFGLYSRRGRTIWRDDGIAVEPDSKPTVKTIPPPALASVTVVWKRPAPDKLVKTFFTNGEAVETTPEHPFLALAVDRVVVSRRADRLKPGDQVLGVSGARTVFHEVAAVENIIPRDMFVYDFTVPETHVFMAQDVFLHNTSLLDRMRGTLVAAREAGGITQHIGATLFPIQAIEETCRTLLGEVRVKLEVPGMLFIDTPGHAAFSNLRRRGGSVADMAVLVIDIMKGVQEQTRESIQLLRSRKTPFVVAVNKIDMISGWKPNRNAPFQRTLKEQSKQVVDDFEAKIYTLMGDLSFLGFNSDLYTRIRSFAETVALVPVSAKTGEGIADLLLVLLGLAQQFMKQRLRRVMGRGEGVVLELVEEEGLGATANVILHSGTLSVGDRVAFLGKKGPTIGRVKALLLPKPLEEIRDPRDKLKHITTINAAAGVKLVAEGIEDVLAGSPIISVVNPAEDLKAIAEEAQDLVISTDKVGVVLKADTLGTLEAAVNYLRERGTLIRAADIGEVSKKDVVEAHVVRQKDELLGVILAYNVRVDPEIERDANSRGVRIFKGEVLFRLVEVYGKWVDETVKQKQLAEFESLTKPGKLKVLKEFIFRRSEPAIVGVEVLAGVIKPGVTLVNSEGKVVGSLTQIQDRGKPVPMAETGAKVAIAVKEGVFGRNIHGDEILFVELSERSARQLSTNYISLLDEKSLETLEEFIQIMRRKNPLWAR